MTVPTRTSSPAVRLAGVSRRFGDRVVLDGVDLEIAAGEFVVLLGRSGSGKSTLLRAVIGLDPDVTGSIEVPDQLAVGFQEARLLPWKVVWRNVALGLHGPDVRQRVLAALAEVELTARADAWPNTLSGGESQRVSLARALVREPQLLVLDEPFGALDALTRLRMHQLLLDLWQRHRHAVLLVTHDVDEALVLADRVLVLDEGRLALDLRIESERPRSVDDADFRADRSRLLAQLGVAQPAPSEER